MFKKIDKDCWEQRVPLSQGRVEDDKLVLNFNNYEMGQAFQKFEAEELFKTIAGQGMAVGFDNWTPEQVLSDIAAIEYRNEKEV